MARTVVIVATLDTKGEEARLIRDFVVGQGLRALVVDVGVLGEPGIRADVARADVAQAADETIEALVESRDKSRAMEAMTRGAGAVAGRLYAEGKLDGIIGIGGSAGTVIGASAMRELPIGVPKLCLSTIAAGDTRPYVGTKDVAMMYSVVDLAGINRVSARVLTNAAAAICGMARADAPPMADRPIIAASMFGNTTACVDRARRVFEDAGYEVLVFHATGTGGQTMESLIADGYVTGVFDVTTTEWADEVCGGVLTAGPHRLDAAAAASVPQVIAPGCLDMVNFWGPESVPPRYQNRQLYRWNPNVTLMRTTPAENARLGQILAAKANLSRGQTAVLLPLRGVSQLDSPGGAFWSPEADQSLFDAIRHNLRPDIRLVEMDHNVNDPEFAEQGARILLEMLPPKPS